MQTQQSTRAGARGKKKDQSDSIPSPPSAKSIKRPSDHQLYTIKKTSSMGVAPF